MAKNKYFLKDLEITKVDFVDAGCNQRANIMITKRDNSKGGENMNTENTDVNVLAGAVVKALKDMVQTNNVHKGVFNDIMEDRKARRRAYDIEDEMWLLNGALIESLVSILYDEGIIDKTSPMKQSVDEYNVTMKECVDKWAIGELAEVNKSANGAISVPVKPKEIQNDDVSKKEDNQMANTDNALTADEQAMLDLLMKKANITKVNNATDNNETSETEKTTEIKSEPQAEPQDDVAKSVDDVIKELNPSIADILKSLDDKQKMAEEAQLKEVAKKYEILGIKTEDMVGVLKSVKGTAQYDAIMKRFDDMVAQVENSGLFTEIGKSGSGSTCDAWSRIEKHADEIMKTDPKMTRAKAIDKACEMHPELVMEYENGR